MKVVRSKLKEDGTLSEPLPQGVNQVDVLVSNPPYVPASQLVDLQPEIKLYEDLRALEAGRDGLRVIKSLLLLAQSILRPGGLIFLEVDTSHPKLIQKWVADCPQLNITFVKTVKDFCEKDRFIDNRIGVITNIEIVSATCSSTATEDIEYESDNEELEDVMPHSDATVQLDYRFIFSNSATLSVELMALKRWLILLFI
ncbi:HemK methyltransferase member 1 [Homalodisca vitripennis]|nr:HemK methyltransferase member 1 [Homalodisca vitripennis]